MQSRTHITAFLLALGVAAIATPLVRRMAYRFGWFDAPDASRKVHRTPLPRLGGIAIALGFYAPITGLLLWDNAISRQFVANRQLALGIFVGGLAILAVGIWDDIRGLLARRKLAFQVVIATVMWAFGFQIERLGVPIVGVIEFVAPVSWAVSVLWFVAIMNAVNLIDGLDGLAGGVAFFALVTMYVVASAEASSNLLTTLYAAALAGAVVGFLFYNFNPATIFMGDCGSLFLGLMLAAVSIQTQAKGSTAIALTASAVALGLPLFDTLLSIVRRLRRGRPVFSADREHIHHRLLNLGFTPRQAALILYALCGALGMLAVITKLQGEDDLRFALIAVAAVLVLVVLNRFFRFRELLHQRRLALTLEDELALPADARLRTRELGRSIREAASLDLAWGFVRQAAELLSVRDVELRLYVREGGSGGVRQTYAVHRDESHLSQLDTSRLVVPLVGPQLWYGDLHFVFRSAPTEQDEERRFLLEMLGEYLVEHLEAEVVPRIRDRFTVTRLRSQSGPRQPPA